MFYLVVTSSSLDRDCSNFCKSVVFPVPILPTMVTFGTHIFTIILQNNLEAISTCEVLIGVLLYYSYLRVTVRYITESTKWVEDY